MKAQSFQFDGEHILSHRATMIVLPRLFAVSGQLEAAHFGYGFKHTRAYGCLRQSDSPAGEATEPLAAPESSACPASGPTA